MDLFRPYQLAMGIHGHLIRSSWNNCFKKNRTKFDETLIKIVSKRTRKARTEVLNGCPKNPKNGPFDDSHSF